jgi:AAA domain
VSRLFSPLTGKGALAMADLDKKILKRLSDYDVIPATDYLIEPYLPMGGLVFVCGLPKTFKTYLSGIDWGYSVATGCQWLGRPVRKGRVAYYALEGYHGVLRRAEAWRIFHKHPTRTATDGLAYITDRLSVPAKTCNVDQHFTTLYNAGYRPDLVQIDTWFKVTAGAGVGEQTDMSVALQNLRNFQNRLTEWKVPDGLPEVTFVVIAHTDKKGQALFGSVTQFADCDVLYQLERVDHADQATLGCIGTRDIEEPPAITFEMEKVGITTAKGNEQNLVVSKEVSILDQILGQPMEETKQSKQDAKKAAKESSLDDLAFRTLAGF